MGNQYYYLKVGKADELDNRKGASDFSFFEMLPGLCSWLTLILMVVVSWQWPVVAAIFIIVFDTYWLIKLLISLGTQPIVLKKLESI